MATLGLFRCDLFDIFLPEIEIVSPREGTSYFGTMPIELKASDNRKVVKVEVFLDGESIHEFTKEPFTASIYVAGQSAGTKTFKTVAYDKAGNWAEAAHQITIWSPTLAGSYDTPGKAYGVFVSGSYTYVADDVSGLQVINVSSPASPTLVGTYDTQGEAWDVYVAGSYAYVADYSSGLQVIDVSNPASPTQAGSYDTRGAAWGVFVSGSYAYVADDVSGLQIIDVSGLP